MNHKTFKKNMENLLSTLQIIEMAFFASIFSGSIDNSIRTGGLKSILRILDVGVLIGAVYLSFTNYEWWKAILLILVLFAIAAIAEIYIKKYLSKQTILIIAIISLVFTAYVMFLKIF